MFWFKKKKIILDCFTTDPFAYEYAPITSALKYYPNWWKELPATSAIDLNSSTMKACRGFTELYKNSFILPFWGHLEVNVKDVNQKQFFWKDNFSSEKNPSVISHKEFQFDGFVGSEFSHLKLTSPWRLKTNKLINFAIIDPVWNRHKLTDYNILPGFIDFKYQFATNINLMVEYREKERTIDINPSEPLAMIVPITEEHVGLKLHLVSEKEMNRVIPTNTQRINFSVLPNAKKYSTIKSFLQKKEKQEQGKCPFGFTK